MMSNRTYTNTVIITALALVVNFGFTGSAAAGQVGGTPVSQLYGVADLPLVPVLATEILDVDALLQEDIFRDEEGLPFRYALPQEVDVSPATDGRWENLPDGSRLWRLRVSNPGAQSLNFGFTHFDLPYGAQMFLYAADNRGTVLVFGSDDNRIHQQLWTPIIFADEVVVELVVPTGKIITAENLTLGVVGCGYREFGSHFDKAGSCNIDVVCEEGDAWRDEIRSAAVYSFGGSTFCSGAMINNTAQDGLPLFLTAHHCHVTESQAPTVVVYWNYESENCGDLGGGTLDEFTTGSTLRASYVTSDMTLIELDDYPDPAFGVTYAGWDRTDVTPTSVVAIHSPGADEKCISFEDDPTETATYLQDDMPGDGTHLRVEDWDLGTTEPGSSGSPLFDPSHRIVGQLHGGYAACGNDLSDWYGRIYTSWEGGGTAATRLSDWLDPLGNGASVIDTYDPAASGMQVTPNGVLISSGDVGGPFSPSSQVYTLENMGSAPFDFSASTAADWISINPGFGSVPVGASVQVTVSISAGADTLSARVYDGAVDFVNATTGEGNAVRYVELTAGQRELAVSFNMDSNPGWSMEGDWAWGVPAGQGGDHGNPDPTSGFTGSNVIGFNLLGDYDDNMAATHMTSEPIDCEGLTDVSLRFQRWLGVESYTYDQASLSISTDGVVFHTIWVNPSSTNIEDNNWTEVEYDISEWADDNPTVTLRWTMGATDGSYYFCGWNIDDIQLWAFGEATVIPEPEGSGRVTILSVGPNPFAEQITVTYQSDAATLVSVRVLNLHGAVVANLGSVNCDVGDNSWVWDGKTTDGRRLSSGVYIIEINSSQNTDRSRITYLH